MPLTSVVDLLIVHQTFLHKVCILDLMGLAVMYFASTSVLSHLTVIAWERYMAIQKWRKYKSIATKRLAKRLALLAWLPAKCVAPPYILAGAKIDVGWFEKFYLPFQGVFWGSAVIITVYFYLMVYLRIRKLQIYQLYPGCALPMGKQKIRIAKTTARNGCWKPFGSVRICPTEKLPLNHCLTKHCTLIQKTLLKGSKSVQAQLIFKLFTRNYSKTSNCRSTARIISHVNVM